MAESTGPQPPAELAPAVEAAKSARRAQDTADGLRAKAKVLTAGSEERERLWRQAYDAEVEAKGHSKKARAMASGWGQGAGAGIAAASAVGIGLGNLVGVLVGGVVAVPGALIGSGVGAIAGPFIKLGKGIGGKQEGEKGEGGKGDEGDGDGDDSEDEKTHQAIVEALSLRREGAERIVRIAKKSHNVPH